MSLLDVQNLCVSIEGKQVLKNLSININPGETHVLMGPNGAGKSTLGNALMGNPVYSIQDGKIIFNSKDLTSEKKSLPIPTLDFSPSINTTSLSFHMDLISLKQN